MKLQDVTHWAEIIASVAVVLSLVFLTLEVRNNTRALDRQAIRDRSEALNAPFLDNSDLPAIIAAVKAVDGPEPSEQALVDRYDITYEQATVLARQVNRGWVGMEADYVLSGESVPLKKRIQLNFSFPDQVLLWEVGGMPQVANADFRAYVERVRRLPVDPIVQKYREKLQTLKKMHDED